MMIRFIDQIKRFQDYLFDAGMARALLALPAPSILALPHSTSQDMAFGIIFDRFIDEAEIVAVARDLFDSGHFNIAVHESLKAVDNYVRDKVGDGNGSGTSLMDNVFSPTSPRLVWSNRKTRTEKDVQQGYHRLFSGSMLGIRNPTNHEFDWIDGPEEALECIVLAQHLLKKAKAARAP
jgi:uncharacterized protein (TIGR02391 family)